jgi:hypothetical protein
MPIHTISVGLFPNWHNLYIQNTFGTVKSKKNAEFLKSVSLPIGIEIFFMLVLLK